MDNGCLVVRKWQVEPAKIKRRRWNRRRTTALQTLTNEGQLKKLIFFCILLFMSYFSCQKLITYKGFILAKTPYTGNELRIDGYYYRYYECSKGSNCIDVRCFYRNGILLDMGGGAISLEEADEYIRKNYIDGNANPVYEYLKWGLFVINEQTIKLECYFPNDDITKWTYIREGIILNDTTFRIRSIYHPRTNNRSETNDLYHFRQFSPKPDSTNNFIK